MNYVELLTTIVLEAQGMPSVLIPDAVKSMVPTILRTVVMSGERIEPLLAIVPPAEARRRLQECREDKEGTLRILAEWQADVPALYAQLEERQKIAKKVLNAR
jgi:hypothetical protein